MKENGLNWVYLKLELLLGAQNYRLFGSKLEIFGSSLKLGNFGLKELIYLSQKPGISLQLSYNLAKQVDQLLKTKKKVSSEALKSAAVIDYNIHPRILLENISSLMNWN